MGSRGASARVGYSFDGMKSRSANIQAAYNSIKNKGAGTFEDFKDMVDYETRGVDGYGLKDGIDAAMESYDDQFNSEWRKQYDRETAILNRSMSKGNLMEKQGEIVARNTAAKNGFKWSSSTNGASKRLSSGNTVHVDYMPVSNKYAVEVSKAANNRSNSLEYALSSKTFKSASAAYKYANQLAKKY